MNIQWYPGHMTKARRMLEENIKLIDVVVELCDARAPLSTRNPDFDKLFSNKYRVVLLNKSDLSDPALTSEWIDYFKSIGVYSREFIARESRGRKAAIDIIERACREKVERMRKKGVLKTVRAMVVGIPNVGKSTLINTLAHSQRAQVGDRPGVTQGKQWVKISNYLEIMDTPGMLWPKFEDETVARHIAYIGSVRDDILDIEELSRNLLSELMTLAPDKLYSRYPYLENAEQDTMLEALAIGRGFILKANEPDTLRASKTLLDEFRAGKIGRITLERPQTLSEVDKDGD